jgi:hypothetical protein
VNIRGFKKGGHMTRFLNDGSSPRAHRSFYRQQGNIFVALYQNEKTQGALRFIGGTVFIVLCFVFYVVVTAGF